MGKRKRLFVAKHKHKYILDENSFGICKCGATKQFPKESKLKLRPSEISAIEGLDMSGDLDGWLHSQLPNTERGT